MKKLLPLATSISVFATVSASAAIYFNEDFSYPDGSLTTVTSNWTTHSGTAGQIQVSSGTISLTDSNSEDVNRGLGITVLSGNVYAAFDFSVTAASAASGGDYEYFAHFGNGTSDFTARMDITEAVGAGDFTVGIAGGSGTADQTWATDLTFGQTYRAVIGYNRDTGISSLWIDPGSEASTSIVSGADTNDVTSFYFRQSASSVDETIVIDNLVTADDFTQALTGVPEPSIALLGGLGLLGLLRRRR